VSRRTYRKIYRVFRLAAAATATKAHADVDAHATTTTTATAEVHAMATHSATKATATDPNANAARRCARTSRETRKRLHHRGARVHADVNIHADTNATLRSARASDARLHSRLTRKRTPNSRLTRKRTPNSRLTRKRTTNSRTGNRLHRTRTTGNRRLAESRRTVKGASDARDKSSSGNRHFGERRTCKRQHQSREHISLQHFQLSSSAQISSGRRQNTLAKRPRPHTPIEQWVCHFDSRSKQLSNTESVRPSREQFAQIVTDVCAAEFGSALRESANGHSAL